MARSARTVSRRTLKQQSVPVTLKLRGSCVLRKMLCKATRATRKHAERKRTFQDPDAAMMRTPWPSRGAQRSRAGAPCSSNLALRSLTKAGALEDRTRWCPRISGSRILCAIDVVRGAAAGLGSPTAARCHHFVNLPPATEHLTPG